MDMGQTAGLPQDEPQSEPQEAGGGPIMLCLTIADGRVTLERVQPGQPPTGQGQDMDIGAALKAVLDIYEGSEDEGDQFMAGLREGAPAREPKPTTNGMRMG